MDGLRTLAVGGLLLTCPLWIKSAFCAIHRDGPQPERKQQDIHEDIRVESILQTATVAPPELAADLLLQLVEKGLIKGKTRRIEILREAFDLAPGARFALRRVITGAGKSRQTDTDVGVLAQALRPGLDALSLRVRAVQQMLRLNPTAALDMFTQIPSPEVPSLSCNNATGYSIDDYYATVGMLYSKAFGPAAHQKNLGLEFLTSHLASLRSPFELEPAARLLIELPLSQSSLAEAMSIYDRRLTNLQSDDRSFTAATNYSLVKILYELAQLSERKGGSAYGLVSSLGSYIDQHLRAVRCADTASSPFIKGVVDQFNTLFHKLGPDVQKVPLIPADDLRPTSLGDRAEVYAFWDGPESKRLLEQGRHLRFGAPEEQADTHAPHTTRGNMAPYLGLSQRKTPAWGDEASALLKNVDDWDVKDEPGTAGFHEKCLMYSGLLDIAPKGEFRHLVFSEFLAFLRNSSVETDNPPEWALHLTRLLTMRYEEDQSGFSQDVAQSGDATMQLFAELTALTSPK